MSLRQWESLQSAQAQMQQGQSMVSFYEYQTVRDLLCELCAQHEYEELDLAANVRTWWDKERPEYEKRKAVAAIEAKQQAARSAALAKLTAEEREALGL